MKSLMSVTAIALSSLLSLPHASLVAQSLNREEKNYFRRSPRLIEAFSTYKVVRVWSATYYFTLEIPETAGNSLQSVVIQQRSGTDNNIRYDLTRTVAFVGTFNHREEVLSLASVTQDPQTQAITLNFITPIPAGTTFTVALKPIRNPDYDGVYLFGVTVFPQGNNPQGLYLGVGRFHFYQGGSHPL